MKNIHYDAVIIGIGKGGGISKGSGGEERSYRYAKKKAL